MKAERSECEQHPGRLLRQGRYSLFVEGRHRSIDTRRYGKLGTLPIDQPGQRLQTAFPSRILK